MGPTGPFFLTGVPMANTYDRDRKLQDEVGSRVEQDLPGVEVLAVELANPERFVVYVDHPEGVDHALCARVTDALRDYLREYSIDVSSPGTDRPLRKPEHFASVVGRSVKLRTRDRKLRGAVVAANANAVKVDETEIPYDEIVRANLID